MVDGVKAQSDRQDGFCNYPRGPWYQMNEDNQSHGGALQMGEKSKVLESCQILRLYQTGDGRMAHSRVSV